MPTTHPQLSWLAGQHERIRGIVEGLDEQQLRSSVLPSGWSPLGMIGHLRETTRFWAFQVMLDQHPPTSPTDDFDLPPGIDPGQVIGGFRDETSRALAALARSHWTPRRRGGRWARPPGTTRPNGPCASQREDRAASAGRCGRGFEGGRRLPGVAEPPKEQPGGHPFHEAPAPYPLGVDVGEGSEPVCVPGDLTALPPLCRRAGTSAADS